MPEMNGEPELENLKALLRFKKISYKELSEAIGVSIGTFSEKINNRRGRSFTISEVKKICEYVEINQEEIPKYFF